MCKVNSAKSGILFSYFLYIICYLGTINNVTAFINSPSPNLASYSSRDIRSISRRSDTPNGETSSFELRAFRNLFANTGVWDTALSRTIVSNAGNMANVLLQEVKQFTPVQSIVLVATFLIGFRLGRVRPFWNRLTSVLDIPSAYFGPNAKILKGRALSVTDGDTIRFLHVPTWFHPRELSKNKRKKEKLSTVCLPIRFCTIDAPETAKFGKPGQPFGDDAKAKVKELLERKVVKLRLLTKDQYGRAVAEIFTGSWPMRKFVDAQMLEAGLAEVYQGTGAVYGPLGFDRYMEMEREAKKRKRGIWSQKKVESAAEFKRRTKS